MIKKQLGLTMIELMVSMMLGLGLIAGVGQLFVQSQKSFTMQRNFSDMTDDATFVLEDLAKGILLAGYSEDGATTQFIASSDVLSSGINFNQNEFIKGTDSKLIYRFRLDSTQSQENNSICIVDSYSANDVVPVYILYKDSEKSLSCTSKNAAQPMISEVEKLEFRYGIKATANSFYYAKAADVTDWTKVFAIKVFLVMRSVDDKLTKNKIKYKIEDTEYTAPDNRLYKVFSKTIFLRAPTQ